jgi:hypothetical protein
MSEFNLSNEILEADGFLPETLVVETELVKEAVRLLKERIFEARWCGIGLDGIKVVEKEIDKVFGDKLT